jgi:hypothetical protein
LQGWGLEEFRLLHYCKSKLLIGTIGATDLLILTARAFIHLTPTVIYLGGAHLNLLQFTTAIMKMYRHPQRGEAIHAHQAYDNELFHLLPKIR